MPLFLKRRDKNSKERMDDPDCDKQELFNTYDQFSVINSLISRWQFIYKNFIKNACSDPTKTYTLLDIGFGGGDLPIKISKWAKNDRLKLDVTAIETDSRATEYVQGIETPPEITFRQISSTDLIKEGQTFDFVISNHLLHHLSDDELLRMLQEARKLSNRRVLFNDIERSDLGYLVFNLLSRPIFRSSFITEDGLTSIKRSFTAEELEEKVPADWIVKRIFPYRLLLSYDHEKS
jgi:2-polyprenyl-3-methyl-5-hydroxy-6-metoxy-1,4-benzoquinol methylase